MGQDSGTERTTVTDTGNPEQIREEIEATRQELGETVAALSAKADVKAQARQKVEETKATIADKKDDLLGKAKETSPRSGATVVSRVSERARQNPVPFAAAGAFAFGFLAGQAAKR